PASIDPRRGRRAVAVKVFGARRMAFGEREIDLSAVEQLVEEGQTRAIGRTLAWAREATIDGSRALPEVIDETMRRVREEGLDVIDDRGGGDYGEFRVFELAAVLNRLRGLRTR